MEKIFQLEAIALAVHFKDSIILNQFRFYVYGGYQILNGSLGDFYSIDLSDNQPKFNWV